MGIEILLTIPKREEDFQKWLEKLRREFDEKIAAHEQGECDVEDGASIRKEAPHNDIMIYWIYEIDLDRLVFHIDSKPLFRLDHLPGNDLFLESIGSDHYGHRAYTSFTPPKYRYNWDAPPPVVVDAAVELYKNQAAGSAAISDLLSAPESMNDREAVRVQVLQVVIGNLMRISNMGLAVRELTQVPDYNHLSSQECSLAWYLFDIAIHPQIFSKSPLAHWRQHGSHQTQWQRKDMCVHLTTHLDDQRNMQAAVARLVADVMKRPDNPTDIVYGVAFSIFHCVIVRIDTQNGFTFEHSDALQFLPSFYATSPSTPGITALARLGYHPDDELISKVAACVYPYDFVTQGLPDPLRRIKPIFAKDIFEGLIKGVLKPPGGGRIGRLLPQELWDLVAFQLYGLKDLIMFAWLSAECRTAAENALRDPIIGKYRLVQALESLAEIDSEVEEDEDNDRYEFLHSARFKFVSSTGHGIMNLGKPGTGAYGFIPKLPMPLDPGDFKSIKFCIED